MTTVQGNCDPRFAAVRDQFQKHFDDGSDVGASFAATLDGELVVVPFGEFEAGARLRLDARCFFTVRGGLIVRMTDIAGRMRRDDERSDREGTL